jgi:hypothetical protein
MTSPLQQIRDNFDAGQATFTREDVHTLMEEIEARGRALEKGQHLLDDVKSWRSGRWSPEWSPEKQERLEKNVFDAELEFRASMTVALGAR